MFTSISRGSRESRGSHWYFCMRQKEVINCEKLGFLHVSRCEGPLPWSHKPTLLNGRFGNCEVGGARKPFADFVPTLRQRFLPTFSANLSPTFANLFCQPLSKLIHLWAPITHSEARVNGFLGSSLWGSRILWLENQLCNYNEVQCRFCSLKFVKELRHFLG